MNWIKRNWLLIVLFLLLESLLIVVGDAHTSWLRYLPLLTAHAQKPSDGDSHVMESHKADATKPARVFDSHHDPFIGEWIEQHCVGVLQTDKVFTLPRNAEQTLTLRCK